MNIKAIWRYSKIVSRWVSGLILVLFLLVFAINAFDEELAPETLALLAVPTSQLADEDNLYLALMGFSAPAGQSILASGQAKLSAYEKSLAEIRKGRDAAEVLSTQNPQALVFSGTIDFLQPRTSSLWRDVNGHRADVEQMLKSNRELYARYLSLHELSGYFDKATPSLYQEFGYVPKEIRALFLADLALRLASREPGQQKQAMLVLDKDVRLWRTMLLGDGSLIVPMMAMANLQTDYLLIADMLADTSLDLAAITAELDRALVLFDPSDWRIGKPMAYEFRSMAFVFEQTDREWEASMQSAEHAWWRRALARVQKVYYKKNATLNSSAKALSQSMKMATAEPASMQSVWRETEAWQDKNPVFGPGLIYNPIGKILSGVAAPSYADYAFRGYDAAALQRLVKLGYEIRRQGVPEKDIPQFIEKHPQWATHPVSGAFFKWDDEKGEIALEPVATQPKGRRFSIPVWKQGSGA